MCSAVSNEMLSAVSWSLWTKGGMLFIHSWMHFRTATKMELTEHVIVDTLYLIIRIIFFFVFALTLNALGYAVCLFILVFAMLIAIIQPYKPKFAVYNKVDTVFILILALYYCTLMCVDIASMKDHRYKTKLLWA